MMNVQKVSVRAVVAVWLLLTVACTDSPENGAGSTTAATTATTAGNGVDVSEAFDDHTVPGFDSDADLLAFARQDGSDRSVVKFSIPNMTNDDTVYWMDSKFYGLHDEWYWFRLLNGQPVPSIEVDPVQDQRFETIDEVYEWAKGEARDDLPLDLRFSSGDAEEQRLYSNRFYDEALGGRARNYGVGSLLYVPANEVSTVDRWVIELEYSDDASPEEIARYIEVLAGSLPDKIGDILQWSVRSPANQLTAKRMQAEQLPYHDRIVSLSDLIPRGDVSVYNEGIAVGRLLMVDGESVDLTDSTDNNIVLVENVPDWLPSAAAVISSAPQTPLAHVNLLARNRGIPNASLGGLLDDPAIQGAAAVQAPAIVAARGTDQLEIVLITEQEYAELTESTRGEPMAVPTVDLASIPLMHPLETLSETIQDESDVEALRPIIGGKSAGFLAMLAAEGVTTPETPLAVTVRPYFEHLAKIEEQLMAMLSSEEFRSSARARYFLLEGGEDYAELYDSDGDGVYAANLTKTYPPGTPVGDVIEADGFKKLIRDQRLNPETLADIERTLADTYGAYADTQGLRFRSSSSVEDIEGFSGAGLYDSNTGFLFPQAQTDEDDQEKTIEATIKKTWASYWAFGAYEERRRENIDHLSGGMGVLIHARFDDPLERNNGVAVFTLLPSNHPSGDVAIAVVNTQLGDVSVTNPDPAEADLPEVIEVRIDPAGHVAITRVATSTLARSRELLDTNDVMELVTQLRSVTELWRSRINATLSVEQRIETVTLDFEFKTMEPGWPSKADGPEAPSRLVIKQARSLDPGLRAPSDYVLGLPIPRDVLARAKTVAEIACGDAITIEVTTDPLLLPDVGYSQTPLTIGPEPGVDCRRTEIIDGPRSALIKLLETADRIDLVG